MLMEDKRVPNSHRSPGRSLCEILSSEKLVWLAAVSSLLLSPGRERAKIVRKKSRQHSIFAFPRRSKVFIEAEEPSSPKVSCIGQVNTSSKRGGGTTDKKQQCKAHTQSKWASLFSFRSDMQQHPLSKGPPFCGSEVSRIGLPSCESSFFCNTKRNSGAALAKSLMLLQECGDQAPCISNGVVQTVACKDGEGSPSKVYVPREQSPRMQGDLEKGDNESGVSSISMVVSDLCDVESRITPFNLPCKGRCEFIRSDSLPWQDSKDVATLDSVNSNACAIDTRDSPFTLSCKESKEVTSTDSCTPEKVKYPSLSLVEHQVERLSVMAAMEVVSGRDGEGLGVDRALRLNSIRESEIGSSGKSYPSILNTHIDGTTCKSGVNHASVEEEEKSGSNNIEMPCKEAIQNWQGCDESQFQELKEHNLNVISKEHTGCVFEGICRGEWQGQHFCDDIEPKRKLVNLNTFDCVVSSVMALPQLSEEDLHCFLIGKDTNSVWDIHVAKRNDACSAQANFIFLDYGLCGNPCRKDARDGVVASQHWTVAFHDARGGEAKFFRSHSAKSYRTVLTLRRSKSEPPKTS